MENRSSSFNLTSCFPCENNLNEYIQLSSHTQHHFNEYTKKTESQILCDPCVILEKEEIATSLCCECNEYLCSNCTKQHKTRKLTKSHVLKCPVNASVMVECGLCDNETDQKSSVYCSHCQETLCKRCEQKHKEKKIFKHHNLLLPDKTQKQIICDPCKENDKLENAETFCSLCEENLCNTCSRYHRVQKATKDHELKSYHLNAIETLCDPCKSDGMATQVTRFCAQCDERFCDECARQHKSMKMMKDHQIKDIIDVSKTNVKVCSQCQEANVFRDAVNFCSDCGEYLCSDCCKKHIRFKLSKYHTLLSIEKNKQIEMRACDVCKKETEQTQGCEQCGLRLCNVCCKEEQRVLQGPCKHELQPEQEKEIQRSTVVGNSKTEDMITDVEVNDTKNIERNKNRPGKPRVSGDISDVVCLMWDPPLDVDENDYYQIGFKDLESDRKWKVCDEKFKTSTAELDGLPSDSLLVFRVRVINEEKEGPYSEESNKIRTPMSAASQIFQKSEILSKGNLTPSIYSLPMKRESYERVKINKFQFGSPKDTGNNTKQCKTILLLGGTGSGKSTLIDFIVNYTLGVNWNDPFRFKVTDLDQETRRRKHIHVTSLTDCITCFTINYQKGSRINYQLNLIDTPGFGNTGGLKRDQETLKQMRDLLSDNQPYGLALVDAICLVVKANENRLTSFHAYIFQSILSLFGKDVEQHICTLITFADSMESPVLDTLKEYKFPFGETFIFNNACLFCASDSAYQGLDRMFWQIGVKSLRSFFTYLEKLAAKSLHLTKMVLRNRFILQETTETLLCQMKILITLKKKLDQAQQTRVKDRSDVGSNQINDVGSEIIIEELEQEVKAKSSDIKKSINSIRACHDRLKDIALFSRPSSVIEYIGLLIQNEEIEKSEGFLERIKLLKEFRHTVTVEDRVSSDFEGHN